MIQHDQSYYEWLVSQIEFPRTFKKTFKDLLWQLHQIEFVWIITGDDNRIQDGKDLRIEFLHKQPEESYYFKEYVSVLEIIIAVSRILEFTAGGVAPAWAWRLIENLGLNHYYDPLENMDEVNDIIENLIWRTYDRSGKGGFFPLLFPKEDQTKVEIWYQLNAYVLEIVQNETS